MARRNVALDILLLICLTFSACASKPTPDVQAIETQTAAKIFATQTASVPEPTNTPTSTNTPLPTDTPSPSSTVGPSSTPRPTNTPKPTMTVLPSDTPRPTLTATATYPQVVASKVVNLRAGPGTSYPTVGAAKAGDRYDITARNQDGSWFEVCCVNSKRVWVARSVVTVSGDMNSVALAQNIPPPPTKQPASAPATTGQDGQRWTLVADAAADFPGGQDHNHWYYLWTEGRNNFQWQDTQRSNENGCYRDNAGLGLEICQDSIKADPRGDIGLQWKASRGGTYRFEWDSPWLKFYKHTEFVGTQGKGAELPFSATITGVIDWEMFFWVAGDSTSYHVRIYRLDETSGASQAAAQPAPAAGGASEIGVRKEAAGIALTVLNIQKTYQITEYWDAAPGAIALVIEVVIENTGRDETPYNPLYFEVQDSTGAVYNAHALAPEPDLPAGTLLRGEEVRGMVAFVVPQSSTGFTVMYEPLVLFGGYNRISVRLGV